jgi:hypothetical protein
MTIDESVNIIVSQMLGGVMLHAQLSHFFNFLGLKGYAECQKYRYYEESSSYMDLNDYYICHYNKFVSDDRVENQNVIPADWYNFTRFDVNEGIRKNAIKMGVEKWVQWEKETKAVLEQHYQNLIALGEIAIARKISDCIKHVDNELAKAQKVLLKLKAIDYNISDIMMEQEDLYKKYEKKIKEIELL